MNETGMRRGSVILALAGLAAVRVWAGDFEFVVIGDTRPRFESESFRPFESLIARINALKPALVINLGDLIYGYGLRGKETQWDKYETVIQAFRVPYYQLPGNHDTHSKAARRIYSRRFGKFYESFDRGDCHFVLLDNTENERWGYLGPAQFEWLKGDLKNTRARSVFVFFHFPVWELERITPEYHEFWRQQLHPLFRQSRVRAVFAGHYHTYGPTREFDGIRYIITGGGGAELRPDYRKAGGEHHFVRVKVTGDTFEVRVVTEEGELTDPEADVMGGLQFAARNVSRIGLRRGAAGPGEDVTFSVAISNPYEEPLSGKAEWLVDTSAFLIQPQSVSLQIRAGETQQQSFTLKPLKDLVPLQSLPRLEFNVVSGARRHRFHREVRFLEESRAPYRLMAPVLDGRLADWEGLPSLALREAPNSGAELRACHDGQNLYLALSVPRVEGTEEKESGFIDQVQIGLARPVNDTDFGGDLLRLGFNADSPNASDRTPGRKTHAEVAGIRRGCRTEGQRTTYEIAVPFRLLKNLKVGPGARLILDLAFQVPEGAGPANEPPVPSVNTFPYRVRYGSDSLVPVHFVELNLEPKGR